MKLSRRRFLIGASAFAFSTPPQAAEAASLSFLVLGDWGNPARREDQMRVAKAMADKAQAVPQQFVLSVGDNFYGSGVDGVSDQQWLSSFEEIYASPALQCPWYVVLGNHDHRGDQQAEIDYGLTNPRWRMPSRYYSFVHDVSGTAQAEFFCLDTQSLVAQTLLEKFTGYGLDRGAQLQWLDQALSGSRARWKIVVGHHPVFSAGSHGDTADLIALLKPLLLEHGVHAYLNGHDHDLSCIEDEGIAYFTSGAGAEARPVKPHPRALFSEARIGFLAACLKDESAEFDFIGDDGTVLFKKTIA